MKIDFKKELKHLYSASAKQVSEFLHHQVHGEEGRAGHRLCRHAARGFVVGRRYVCVHIGR